MIGGGSILDNLEWAKALIATAEQTYIEDYYGDNLIPFFGRNQVTPSTDTNGEHVESTEGKSV
jgi:hypothetical protein